jgi:hypothetical protein
MRKYLLTIALLLAAGCSNKLETGYEPRPLNMSLSQRRTLYADPFSNEAGDAADKDKNSTPAGLGNHQPGGGY